MILRQASNGPFVVFDSGVDESIYLIPLSAFLGNSSRLELPPAHSGPPFSQQKAYVKNYQDVVKCSCRVDLLGHV